MIFVLPYRDQDRGASLAQAFPSGRGRISHISATLAVVCLIGWPVAGANAEPEVEPPRATTLDALVWIPGPTQGDTLNDLAIDAEGNLFVSGYHSGLDTNRDGVVDVPAAGVDPLYMKLSPEGTVQWVNSPSCPREFDQGGAIAADHAGGMYATGLATACGLSFNSNLRIVGQGASDGYLVRYGSGGELLWTRTIVGRDRDRFFDVASDPAGNAYVIGTGRGEVTLEGYATPLRSKEGAVHLLASFSRDGDLRWLKTFPAVEDWSLLKIVIAPDSDIWVAGSHGSAGIDFDGDGRTDVTGREGINSFLARFDSGGNFEHAWSMTPAAGSGRNGAAVAEIAFAANGDPVIGGMLVGSVDLDGDGVGDASSPQPEVPLGFIARYSAEGALRWVRTHTIDEVWDLASDGEYFVLAGHYSGERDLNQDGRIDAADRIRYPLDAKEPYSELLVLVLDEEGRLIEHINAPGVGHDQARTVAFVPGRPAFWAAGFFRLTADFSGDASDNEGYLRCDAFGDLFLARYVIGAP